MLSQHLCDDFSRDGFVILKNALPEEKVTELESFILDEAGLIAGDTWGIEASPRPHGHRADSLEELFAAVPDKVQLSSLLYQRLLELDAGHKLLLSLDPYGMAQTLLGIDRSHFFLRRESTVVRVDLPGPSPIRLGWHQEVSYDPTKAEAIQFWLPLFRTSSWEAGSVEVAEGSHREGVMDVPLANPGGPGTQQYLVANEIVDRYPQTCVSIDPGDVAVLNTKTIHRSSDPARQQWIKISVIGRCLNVEPKSAH